MMGRLYFLCIAFSALSAADLSAAEPRSEQRMLLRTIAGDIVLALYPELAPRHVAQIRRLVKAGVYDTTHFYRVESNFVLQLSNASDRVKPLSEEQKGLIESIPAEFSGLRHRRGTLSMARYDNRPDSAETSFSILLADAPHLDNKYTIFGHVEKGMDVVEELVRVPRDAKNRPRMRLSVASAHWFDTKKELNSFGVMGRIPLKLAVREIAKNQGMSSESQSMLSVGLVFMILSALGVYFGSLYFDRDKVLSLSLLSALVGGTILFAALLPTAPISPWIGLGLFVMLMVVFKAMSRFESPVSSKKTSLRK